MATSGSYDFSLTANQLIHTAAEDLGIIRPGQTLDTNRSTAMLRRLNMLVKQLQGESDGMPGVKIHSRQRVHLFLANGQQTYLIGPGSSDAMATTQYGRTTIDVSEASGQTVISVTATSDTTTMPGTTITATANDFVGIQQNDGTIHWSTVSTISAGDTITIADATTAAASVGNYVWWFTSRAQRFPLCEAVVVRDANYDDRDLSVFKDVRGYEIGVPNKYAAGSPMGVLIEPLRTQTRVTLDTQPEDVTETLLFTVLYPAEDYDALTNDIAFPQEAFAYLSCALAKRCVGMLGATWTPVHESNYADAIAKYAVLNPETSTTYYRKDA